MTLSELFYAAADRVQFRGWCQNTFARDARGAKVGVNNPTAIRWCARGALKADAPKPWLYIQATETLRSFVGDPFTWNDAPEQNAGAVAEMFRRITKAIG